MVEKIAAGEVVERPASVVKELVENSLDAEARYVRVEIVGGGCDLIRVVDDGVGMEQDDLSLAVRRHATSKISSADDLAAISTLGFRGEALASIAAVSHLTMVSRRAQSDIAYELKVDGGVHSCVVAAARAPGTTVVVEQLFYNVPARRKFLRSAASEAAQVSSVLEHLALAYPEVRFELIIDGRLTIATAGNGDPSDAAAAVLGREVAAALLPISSEIKSSRGFGTIAAINGFVADPAVNRPNRLSIWLFVNRRAVRSRPLSFAIEEAYQTLLPVGRHPIAIVDVQVPPNEVDVNVHPTKSEVKLLRERLIYGGIRDAVRETLHKLPRWAQQIRTIESSTNDEHQAETGTMPLPMGHIFNSDVATTPNLTTSGRRLPILRLMGQVAQSYIVAEGEKGLYLIDQHAAHERVLYHRLMRAMDCETNSQLLLEPIALELRPDQLEVLAVAKEALESLGFRTEPFGESTILVRGVPNELPSGEAVRVLEEALEDLAVEGIKREDWRERMAVALSCRGAIKAGQSLKPEEMRSLIEALEETDITQQCSHGRPTAILLSHQQLEREFGRR